MADEPHFPAPEHARPTTATNAGANAPVVAAAGRVVVARAAAPEEERDAAAPKPAKLTSEEIKSLVAVHGALRPSPASRAWKRGRVILVPTGLLGFVGHYWIGGWADVLAFVIAVAALLWSARPLLRRDEWS